MKVQIYILIGISRSNIPYAYLEEENKEKKTKEGEWKKKYEGEKDRGSGVK